MSRPDAARLARWPGALALTAVLAVTLAASSPAPARAPAPVPGVTTPVLTLPLAPDSVRFAVIGDNGTGKRPQYETADRLAEWHGVFPFTFVLMLGDNMYGSQNAADYLTKFERPYQPLIRSGVEFFAALGNHDDPRQLSYPRFNMKDRHYYSFVPAGGLVRFVALDSGLEKAELATQLQWLDQELAQAQEPWKVVFFHTPLYSSGDTHGPNIPLRRALEPILVRHGVRVVFSGHEHFYERIVPQQGITYFISGAAGQLREGNVHRSSPITAKAFDTDRHFMLVEIAGDALHFQAVSRLGETVDSGTISRGESTTR